MTGRDACWAISMVRDEEDVVASMLGQMVAEGVDGIIVADNRSTDGTRSILDDFATRSTIPVIVLDDPEVAYEQSRKMTNLARIAHDHGAEWILPVDADECWYNRGDRLADHLRSLPPTVLVVQAPLYNHFRTALDLDDPDPFRSMIYRQREPGALAKVACRWRPELVIEMGNHGANYPGRTTFGDPQSVVPSSLELRHFPYRSSEQFIRKARNGGQAFAATGFPEHIGAHWRQYNALIEKFGEEAFIRDVWDRYYYFVSPSDGGLVHDPAPYLRFGGPRL